jgi:hypothetical protein
MRYAFLTLLLFSQISFAYNIPNHRLITQRAIQEFNACSRYHHFGGLTPKEQELLIQGNLSEDYNIFTKTLRWHFFHPEKNLNHKGYNAIGISRNILPYFYKKSVAVHRRIAIGRSLDNYEFLGNLIHFLQDMSCPPHIVPIFHTALDSFDNYPLVPDYSPENRREIDCGPIQNLVHSQKSKHPLFLIQEQFDRTSRALQKEILTADHTPAVIHEGKPFRATWEAFWAGINTPDFGQYGIFGNSFGTSHISVSSGFWVWRFFSEKSEYDLNPIYYHEFAKQQHRDAIDVTLEAIYWLKRSENFFPNLASEEEGYL